MNTNNPSLKELFQPDINNLLTRFKKFELDEEERNWHFHRYFKNLDTSDPLVLTTLKEVLIERINTLKAQGLVSLNEDEKHTYEVLQQFYTAANQVST